MAQSLTLLYSPNLFLNFYYWFYVEEMKRPFRKFITNPIKFPFHISDKNLYIYETRGENIISTYPSEFYGFK